MQQTIIACIKCGKYLKRGEKEYCEKHNDNLCAECRYRAYSGTDTITKFNQWLRSGK